METPRSCCSKYGTKQIEYSEACFPAHKGPLHVSTLMGFWYNQVNVPNTLGFGDEHLFEFTFSELKIRTHSLNNLIGQFSVFCCEIFLQILPYFVEPVVQVKIQDMSICTFVRFLWQ